MSREPFLTKIITWQSRTQWLSAPIQLPYLLDLRLGSNKLPGNLAISLDLSNNQLLEEHLLISALSKTGCCWLIEQGIEWTLLLLANYKLWSSSRHESMGRYWHYRNLDITKQRMMMESDGSTSHRVRIVMMAALLIKQASSWLWHSSWIPFPSGCLC